jgi:tRNA nucleotidyltransferase (CCA-adding enzyme)
MIRAVRFEQRFGFTIEERTLQLIDEARPMVRQVSGERLRHELNLIFEEEKCFAMLARLQQLDLLCAIHPGLHWSEEYIPPVETVLRAEIDPRWNLPDKVGSLPLRLALAYLVWLFQHPADDTIEIAERLRMPKEVSEMVTALTLLSTALPALHDIPVSQATMRLDGLPDVVLYLAYQMAPDGPERQLIEHYRDTWRQVWPYTDGNVLRDRGIPPGPHYKRILGTLRAGWLDGTIATQAEEQALLETLLAELPQMLLKDVPEDQKKDNA